MSIDTSTKKLILSALGAALFHGTLGEETPADWGEVLRECRMQAVLPIVYEVLEQRLPEDAREEWKNRQYAALANNVRVISGHVRLHRLLTENGVPYVILKGCAASRYYPRPQSRMMGDVDFLVDPAEAERCGELLLAHGFTDESHAEHPYHREYACQGVSFELHWGAPGIPAVGGEKIRAYLGGILESAVLHRDAMGEYYVPDDFHHGLVLLLHTAAHMSSEGVGLRHLCDWAVFIEQIPDSVVLGAFRAPLEECGLWEFARVLTATAARHLGASERAWAALDDPALPDELMDDIWEGGNFGRKDQQRHDFGKIGRDFETRRVSGSSFPAQLGRGIQERAVRYFPGLARHKLLRPLAWLAVLLRYGFRVVTGKSIRMDLRREAEMLRERGRVLQKLKLFETAEKP